jgi:thiol-disulfide isomerase/thioredoxin
MIRAIVKYAMDLGDDRRIVTWGERSLELDMEQPQVLERVSEILLESEDKARAERALKYASKFEEILRSLEKEGPSTRRNRAQLLEELDRAIGRALRLQARATGLLGKTEEAIALAAKGYEAYPSAAGAREMAHWYEKAGRNMDAVRMYAEAFTALDPKNTDAQRAKDRARMAALYRKEKNTEAGLGDLVLEAYDRMHAESEKLLARQRARDPNARLSDPMDFTLKGVEGDSLKLASLRGKVVVMDFWATWCGPCRVQQPLYEEVKKRFQDRDDVVFININTDEDPSIVKPFLDQNGWNKNVYFEDGLSQLLRVSSIPTTVVINKRGEIHTRMNGFVPEKFVDQLTGVIREAL